MNSTIAFEIVLAAVTFALGVTIGPRLTRRFDSWWDKRSNVSRSKSAKRLREEYAHCRQLNRRPTLFYLESFRSIAEILFLIAFGVFIAVEVASSVPLLITPSFFTGPSILQWLDSSNHDPILARILVYFSVGLGLILLLAIIRLTDTVMTNATRLINFSEYEQNVFSRIAVLEGKTVDQVKTELAKSSEGMA